MAFWKKNLAFSRLAIVTNLEYRMNYLIDAVAQPMITTAIEVVLWFAIFKSSGAATIAGFPKENYLAYALWAAFFARIAASWMYEFMMTEEIESGSVNTILVRPVSFYEYYLAQLIGYKVITTVVSFVIPIVAILIFGLPTDFSRLPLATALVLYFMLMVHAMSFIVASLGFFINRVHSFTITKNLALWVLTGELFPLDLLPDGIREVMTHLPFASAVFVPVGYLTGRVEIDMVYKGFLSVTLGILFFNLIGFWLWRKGVRRYSGTGA